MDAKVTLSFNKSVIEKAKKYADENNISLSRLTEFLLSKVTSKKYQSLEDLPISDWVSVVGEGNSKPEIEKLAFTAVPGESSFLLQDCITSKPATTGIRKTFFIVVLLIFQKVKLLVFLIKRI